jgi:glycosyltransferase involved in cell wall biosynthesis
MWHGRLISEKNKGIEEMTVHFMIPGDINERAGGYIYDKEIITSLTGMGCEVIVHEVHDDFPCPEAGSIEQCRQGFRKVPDNGMVVVDGLVGGAIGALIRENSERLTVVSLIHLPLTVTPWSDQKINRNLLRSERTALHFSDAIVVTSEFAKTALLQPRYDCKKEKITVIEPGWHNTHRKKSYRELPLKLLCVANIIERKGYITFVNALGRLTDKDWNLTCCGNMDYDPSYVRNLIKRITEHGLDERIFLKGSIQGKALVDEYLSADLFVFPSWYETYGMALTEAAGYGLPIVTSVDGATNRHLSRESTVFFHPDDVSELEEVLRELLTNPLRYVELCEAAHTHILTALSWTACAERFLSLLTENNKKKRAF